MANKNRVKNKIREDICNYLRDCQYWTELNMMLDISGYELSTDIILTIIHFAFAHSIIYFRNSQLDLETELLIRQHARTILQEMVEDTDYQLSNDMVDKLVQKSVFYISHAADTETKTILRDIFKTVAKRYPAQVKKSYNTYIQFSTYRV